MRKWTGGLILAVTLTLNITSVVNANESTIDEKEAESSCGQQSVVGLDATGEAAICKEIDESISDELFNNSPLLKSSIGWQEDAGYKYYYDTDGKMCSGWEKIDGSWYYFDEENTEHPCSMVVDTEMSIGGYRYSFDGNGVMRTGWFKKTEGWYYANNNGQLQMGWLKSGGKWYFLNPTNTTYPGLMVSNTVLNLGEYQYIILGNGEMKTGWEQNNGKWYYYDDYSGRLVSGWEKIDGLWYYFDENNTEYPCSRVEDSEMSIGGYRYSFDKDGAMRTGWFRKEEGWYYADNNGWMQMGWLKSGGKWYFLNPSNTTYPGLMVSNTVLKLGGYQYVFLSNGEMKTGWEQNAGSWYYYDDYSGQLASGWKKIGGLWYYFDPVSNKMFDAGWHRIGTTWYYMEKTGSMATGWKQLNGGKWFYFGSSGAMATGWRELGGYWYYFYKENDVNGGLHGSMAKNTTIDGYRLRDDGRLLSEKESRIVNLANMYSSSTNYMIIVDRAACETFILQGARGMWRMVYDWPCSPGKPSTPTVSGVFKVGSKGYYFDSGSARCHWYTQFYNDYLFHSVLYNRDGTLQDGRLGMQLSHGCVRLEISRAKWIYDNIPTTTTVVVI